MPDEPVFDVIRYGPDLPTEAELRLLGELNRRRVLELGAGPYASAVAFARAGATTIAVDASARALAGLRAASEREEVRVELRQGDLADLAFLRAETIDVAFSAYGLGRVVNLGRVLRQVHRVLRPGGLLVFSLTHPAYDLVDPDTDPPQVVRSYWDEEPVSRDGSAEEEEGDEPERRHTFSELYLGLVRAGLRVEQLLEPQPRPGRRPSPAWREAWALVPRTLIVKARKD